MKMIENLEKSIEIELKYNHNAEIEWENNFENNKDQISFIRWQI